MENIGVEIGRCGKHSCQNRIGSYVDVENVVVKTE